MTTTKLRVRQVRQARKLSQAALAEQAGLSRSFIIRMEGGHQSPAISTLDRIAAVLRVKVRDLLIP